MNIKKRLTPLLGLALAVSAATGAFGAVSALRGRNAAAYKDEKVVQPLIYLSKAGIAFGEARFALAELIALPQGAGGRADGRDEIYSDLNYHVSNMESHFISYRKHLSDVWLAGSVEYGMVQMLAGQYKEWLNLVIALEAEIYFSTAGRGAEGNAGVGGAGAAGAGTAGATGAAGGAAGAGGADTAGAAGGVAGAGGNAGAGGAASGPESLAALSLARIDAIAKELSASGARLYESMDDMLALHSEQSIKNSIAASVLYNRTVAGAIAIIVAGMFLLAWLGERAMAAISGAMSGMAEEADMLAKGHMRAEAPIQGRVRGGKGGWRKGGGIKRGGKCGAGRAVGRGSGNDGGDGGNAGCGSGNDGRAYGNDSLNDGDKGSGGDMERLESAIRRAARSVFGALGSAESALGAARSGNMLERARAGQCQGAYSEFIGGLNATLDAVCSYLDAVPAGVAIFSEADRMAYLNSPMRAILARHGMDADSESLLARLISSGSSARLNRGVSALFSCGGWDREYAYSLALDDYDGERRYYEMRLCKVGGGSADGCGSGADIGAGARSAPGTDFGGGAAEHSVSGAGARANAGGGAVARQPGCVMLAITDATREIRAKKDAEQASRLLNESLSGINRSMGALARRNGRGGHGHARPARGIARPAWHGAPGEIGWRWRSAGRGLRGLQGGQARMPGEN
ncbi:MAG: hypothetical protein LBJ10_09920 [Clostridiales bacterium]|jgi:hypothetical protein|nr:hypothetical protein [Clostridiales bacterium]